MSKQNGKDPFKKTGVIIKKERFNIRERAILVKTKY